MTSEEGGLQLAALGGVNEIGKNMFMLRYGDDIVVVDCGSKFPDESLLGIDLIIPDIGYLRDNRDKVRALVVTHGHEDHIGGIPYLLKQLNLPVYASRLTLGLIESKLKEHGLLAASTLIGIDAGSEVTLGAFTISFFRTNHSIPDCLGIVFETPEGLVVHTGDFKFDLTPVNQEAADLYKMAALGERGVLALLSESTNAERPGFTPSERLVGEHIEDAFDKAEGKIFISTFASNVHRLQQIIEAARKKNRRVALIGRSMVNVVTIAANLGYLTLPEGLLVEAGEVMKLPPEQVVVLCTGSQGEPMAALSRIASANHRQVQVHPGDTVILAATPIPGNERNVARIVDNLFQLRAKVIYGSGSVTGMHVSGHASQEELKLMLSLIKPRYFIPIHGEFRMLHQHRLMAEAVGVTPENIFIVKNGDVVEISGGKARMGGTIPSGNTLVDGLGIGDVGNIVLRDRKHLSEDGILIVVLTLSKADGTILAGPDIISRGFVYIREAEQLMEEINRTVIVAVEKLNESHINGWSVYKQTIKDSIGTYLFTKIKRRPMILPIIIEV